MDWCIFGCTEVFFDSQEGQDDNSMPFECEIHFTSAGIRLHRSHSKFSDDKINRIFGLSRYSFAAIKWYSIIRNLYHIGRFYENSTRCGKSLNQFKSVDVNDSINDGCDMIVFYVNLFFCCCCPTICLSLQPHKCLQFIKLYYYYYFWLHHFSLIFRYGRKITFYISVALIMIGRVANLFTPSYFLWFAIFSVIGSLCLIALFQAPYVIAIEISET